MRQVSLSGGYLYSCEPLCIFTQELSLSWSQERRHQESSHNAWMEYNKRLVASIVNPWAWDIWERLQGASCKRAKRYKESGAQLMQKQLDVIFSCLLQASKRRSIYLNECLMDLHTLCCSQISPLLGNTLPRLLARGAHCNKLHHIHFDLCEFLTWPCKGSTRNGFACSSADSLLSYDREAHPNSKTLKGIFWRAGMLLPMARTSWMEQSLRLPMAVQSLLAV